MGNLKGVLPEGVSIDFSDYPLVQSRTWRITKNGYVAAKSDGRVVYLHRIILSAPKGHYVDHINGIRVDNRRCNLRVVTPSESRMNSVKRSSKTSSKYKGVYWNSTLNSWCACITLNGRHVFHQRCGSEVEASRIYNREINNVFGEFQKGNEL